MAVARLLFFLVCTAAVLYLFYRDRRGPDQNDLLPSASRAVANFYRDWTIKAGSRFRKVSRVELPADNGPVEALFGIDLGRRRRRVAVARLRQPAPTLVLRPWIPASMTQAAGPPGLELLEDPRLGRTWTMWTDPGASQSVTQHPTLVPVVVTLTWSRLWSELPEPVRHWPETLPADARRSLETLAQHRHLGIDFLGTACAVSTGHPGLDDELTVVAEYIGGAVGPG